MRVRRLVRALPLLLLIPAMGSAHAATQVPLSGEAWFTSNPTCSLPTGCLSTALPAPLPALPLTPAAVAYPADTLHVSAQAGLEGSRTYVPLPFDLLGDGQSLTAAHLTIPLDTSTADGSVSPETSKVQACTTTGSVPAAAGGTDPAPAAVCTHGVLATYTATPAPQLTFDLQPMLGDLSAANASIVLLPAAGEGLTDTWHVVFSSTERAAGSTPPESLSVEVSGGASPTPDDSPSPSRTTHAAAPSAPPATSAPGTTVVTVPSGPVDVGGALPAPTVDSAVPVPDVAAPPTTEAAVQPAAHVRTIVLGFAYPIVVYVPLVLGSLLLLVGRQLTASMGTPGHRRR